MTYEKTIDKLNKNEFSQVGMKIDQAYWDAQYPLADSVNIVIDNATLDFDYTISQDWATATGSLNTLLKAKIGNLNVPQNLNLLDATVGISSASWDVKNALVVDSNVTISLNVTYGDSFTNIQDIIFSIDNVEINVGYHLEVQYIDAPTTTQTEGTYDTTVIWNENFTIDFTYKS
jgi:hypothetical protein